MGRDQSLGRSRGGAFGPKDSFWRLPRATTKLVSLAAEVQTGIDRGLSLIDCFEPNHQYWLDLHDRIRGLSAARLKDGSFRRLPRKDRHLLENLDDIKLDFLGGMVDSWNIDKSGSLVDSFPDGLRPDQNRPWAALTRADIISRLRHRLNLAVRTDFDHLWSDWLVSSTRTHPLQVGYVNYRLRLAEFQEATTNTKDLIDRLHSQEYLEIVGSGDSLIENQLELLNRSTTRAQGVYDRALQAV